MSITPEPRPPSMFPEVRRRRLFTLLRLAPLALLLVMAVGGSLLCALKTPWPAVLIGVGVVGLVAWPYVMTYRAVMDRSRGLPVAQPCAGPWLQVSQAAWLTEAIDGPGGLIALGFEPGDWFFLDDADQTYVWPWLHTLHPTIAYIQYLSGGGVFRFRFVRCLPGGGTLISTTRLTDIAYPPPPGDYRQMRRARRPADLYGWHREAERFLLGDRPAASSVSPHITAGTSVIGGDPLAALSRPDPVALYVGMLERLSWYIRLKRFWLLRFGLFRELWRQARLAGVSVSEQVEEGWAPPPGGDFPG